MVKKKEMKKMIDESIEYAKEKRFLEIEDKIKENYIELDARIKNLEGLDLSKYLKNKNETDEAIDNHIIALLEISNNLKNLNFYKREAALDYLSKKSNVGKTKLKKVVEVFEQYLEKLL